MFEIIDKIRVSINKRIYELPKRLVYKTCIFCSNPTDNSREHIIPDSINGRISSKDIICDKCNHHFGDNIDPVIKENLNPLLLTLGFENANKTNAEDIDGNKLIVNKDFSIRPPGQKTTEEKIGNKTRIVVAGNRRAAEQRFESIVAKKLASGARLINSSITDLKDTTPYITIKAEIKSDLTLLLLLNKIALEFFCLFEKPNANVDRLCKRVRKSDSSINNLHFCNFHNEIRDFQEQEISHLILIKSDKKTHSLYAYIELFNTICCLIVLDENYFGKIVRLQYQQDALTGSRIYQPIKLKVPFSKINRSPALSGSFQYLMNTLGDRSRLKGFYSACVEMVRKYERGINEQIRTGKILKKDKTKLIVAETEKIFQFLYYQPEFKYIFPGQENDDTYNLYQSNLRLEIVDGFIEESSAFIGKTVDIDGHIYTIDSFYKLPTIVRGDKELVLLNVKLIGNSANDIKYIPIKRFLTDIAKIS